MILGYTNTSPPINVDMPLDKALTYFPNTEYGFMSKMLAKGAVRGSNPTVRFSKSILPKPYATLL